MDHRDDTRVHSIAVHDSQAPHKEEGARIRSASQRVQRVAYMPGESRIEDDGFGMDKAS